jgi:thiamine pyrophosphokinase
VNDAAIVFTGGGALDPRARAFLPAHALVVAADSGLHLADELGLRVDVVVGDLDSADPAAVASAQARGATVERHPTDKDATDLELAIEAAQQRGAERVLVLGGSGGRSDHHLANVMLLASPRFADLTIDAVLGDARIAVVHGGRVPLVLCGAPGSLVSLLPVGGWARGVTTTGLRYPLGREDLAPGTSRGVSNEFAEPRASVVLEAGTLLAVQPFGPRS